jgi:NitT/TauT family transport system substrate-binding protein
MTDAAFVAMRGDLIDARPDVVRGWLNAELDAEQFMADPKNTDEVVSILHKYIPNFSPEALKAALYKKYPASEGGTDVRMVEPFAFPPDVHSLLTDATSFLYTIKGIDTPHLRDNAVDSGPADSVLSKRGLKAPVGKISAQD